MSERINIFEKQYLTENQIERIIYFICKMYHCKTINQKMCGQLHLTIGNLQENPDQVTMKIFDKKQRAISIIVLTEIRKFINKFGFLIPSIKYSDEKILSYQEEIGIHSEEDALMAIDDLISLFKRPDQSSCLLS